MRVITSVLAFTDNAITSSPLPSIKTKPKTVTFADIVHFDNSMIALTVLSVRNERQRVRAGGKLLKT